MWSTCIKLGLSGFRGTSRKQAGMIFVMSCAGVKDFTNIMSENKIDFTNIMSENKKELTNIMSENKNEKHFIVRDHFISSFSPSATEESFESNHTPNMGFLHDQWALVCSAREVRGSYGGGGVIWCHMVHSRIPSDW